ncbi:MAG: hypothetical protein Q4D21_00490 [Phascolarctobacterium sp.]|nr:hypothetical protein [Phascolarctobacterium sp.]
MFFPSCGVSAAFSKEDEQLTKYLLERFHIPSTGCCRINHQTLTDSDTAVVVCNTCASIIEESSAAKKIKYAWEYIVEDEQFVFPDYHGEAITVQDCCMARERTASQQAVRTLLERMNFQVVELPNNRDKADFCNLVTIAPKAANVRTAPKHFVPLTKNTVMTAEERSEFLKQHAKKITTQRIVCSCNACYVALKDGGADVVHILQLLFPE